MAGGVGSCARRFSAEGRGKTIDSRTDPSGVSEDVDGPREVRRDFEHSSSSGTSLSDIESASSE